MSSPLVWLITGCTSGSGLALAQAIAARGDSVIATGRDITNRSPSLVSPSIALLDLDVTSPLSDIETVVSRAVSLFGRIDVLVNNAGMTRLSNLEEASEAFVKAIFDVNLFGAIKVTQAVLPHMRAAKTGTVVCIGAGLGWVSIPFLTHYSLTKAALTMFAEGLHKEIAPLGLRSIIFEPGGFDSQLFVPRDPTISRAPKIADYLPQFTKIFSSGNFVPPPGDIAKLPDAIIDVVKGEGLAAGRRVPVRVVLGPDSLDAIRQKCTEQLRLLDQWEDVSLSVMKEGARDTPQSFLDGFSILDK
ncbi:hypothetical protein B0T19DRAFT_264211 [Cercophora scortea]|uniref:Uncharacterized protein n=1 Tax=Cercophora scortea TaxID=314031 RepID=A0AAE0IBP6_9PEZI|nr:hypothetical protein B0T19DRAFT_264211 [Cercophora scortea]